MIVLVGGEKGGTGKTTLATNLAAMRAAQKRDVLLIDTDPQGSASLWTEIRAESADVVRVGSIQKFGKGLAGEIRDLVGRYEDIVIDAGGRESIDLRAALTVADIAILPVQASQFDLWTIEKMSDLVGQAQAFNPNMRPLVVISRASTNTGSRDVEAARELIAEYPALECAETVIRDRVSFRRAAGDGKSVVELATDEKAAAEMQKLFGEIFAADAVMPAHTGIIATHINA